jgi:hypothetical protein
LVNFDKPSKAKNLNIHVTACFSAMYKQCFSLQLVSFLCVCACACVPLRVCVCVCVTKTSYAFKCNDKHTLLVIYIRKYHVCYWNTKSEHQNNKKLLQICYRKLCDRNLPELTAKKAEFKIKKNRTTKSAELINSAKIVKIMCDYYVPNFVWLKRALSFLRGVCISRPSV